MKKWSLPLFTLLAAAVLLSQPVLQPAAACTGIMLKNTDNSLVHGRTLEFGIPLEPSIAVLPRGHEMAGQTSNGDGMHFTSKYAVLGFITQGKENMFMDGLNEKGLSAGAFFFPDFAQYTPLTPDNQAKALSPGDMISWILSQCATVEEVRQAIADESVVLVPTVLDGWGSEPPGAHFIVYDATGACIVIEPVGGKLVVHDNPLGAMSNAPTFDWHLTNLRNFINLSVVNTAPQEMAGMTFSQLGQGSGLFGLPGDFTPPSRFVRAAIFSQNAAPSENAEKGILQVFHILNNFDIPLGSSRPSADNVKDADYTSLTVARDPQNLCYYYKTYADQTIRKVDLKVFDLDADKVKLLSTKGDQNVIDMSSRLQ